MIRLIYIYISMKYFSALNICCDDRLTYIDMISSKENILMMNTFNCMKFIKPLENGTLLHTNVLA